MLVFLRMRWIDSLILRKAISEQHVKRYDPLLTQPHDDIGAVSTQVIQRQQHTFSHLDILTEKLSGSNDIALEKPGFVIFELDYLFKPSIKNN